MKMYVFSAAFLLSGCQLNVQPQPSQEVSRARLWSDQGHWIQAVDTLESASDRLANNPALYRVLGEAYWRLGIQAMASYAALQPDADELEALGQQVFELEEWLDENQQGSRAAREFSSRAGADVIDGFVDSGQSVVDDL